MWWNVGKELKSIGKEKTDELYIILKRYIRKLRELKQIVEIIKTI